MSTVFIIIILLCRVAQHICNKRTSNQVNDLTCFLKYGAYRNFISAAMGLMLILIGGNGFRCDWPTIIISIFCGSMLALSTGLGLAVLKTGTVALSAMFGTAGMIIPCISGIFLFHEPMSFGQWMGFLLFLISAYFLISSSKKIYTTFSWKTLALLIGVLLAEGLTMLSQQMFAYYVPDGDVSVFSLLSFSILGVVMFIASLVIPRKNCNSHTHALSRELLILGAILAVAVFVINQLVTLLVPMVSPVVLCAFSSGGSTIIGAIVAAVCFHEKVTWRSAIGIVLGVLSLVTIQAF